MNGLKIALLLGISMLLAIPSLGQLKRGHPLTNPAYDLGKSFHFGISLGVNFMDADVDSKRFFATDEFGKTVLLWTDVSQVSPGFNVNIIFELQVKSNLSLRVLPGMSFGQRTFSFYNIVNSTSKKDSIYSTMKIESSMIEVPILFKYSALRHSDVRPYFIGGFTSRYDLAARKKFSEGVYMGMSQLNFYLDLGLGFDFYLPYFKFGTEIKYSRGFQNMLSNRIKEGYEYFPQSIDGIITDMVVISFNFE